MVYVKLVLAFLLVHHRVLGSHHPNNVCSAYIDYLSISTSPNCWYNPDVNSNIFEILARRNIPIEVHNVETEDGYLLTLFRLPQIKPKGIAYLVHPLTQTPLVWLTHENRSLGYVLYREGYEVWLGNSRGSFYSRNHRNLTEDDVRFWNFSFHELGMYDIPADLAKIKAVTNRSDIIFVGYSLSTTSAMVYATMLPEHAKNSIKLFILTGPTIYTNTQSLKTIVSPTTIANVLKQLNFGTIFGSFQFSNIVLLFLCSKMSLLCDLAIEGPKGITNFDPAITVLTFSNMRTRVPVKVIIHYGQINETDKFQQFDYGIKQNLKVYGAALPPLYPIEEINVPVFLMHGERDTAGPVEKVERFYKELPEAAKIYGKRLVPTFNHLDFAFARQYREAVTNPILALLEKIDQ